MLGHGFGKVFLLIDYSGFIFLILILFLLFVAAVIMHLKIRFSIIDKLFFISVLGGLFGFTVLTLAIPLALYELAVLKHKSFLVINRVVRN